MIKTSRLNQWLAEVTRHHPPAGLKGKFPKLNYITQTNQNPPTFKVFGRDVNFLHWSYKRYMEKELRQEYDLVGTPVEFVFINNSGKNKDHGN